jgi:hypothetical protein
MGNAALQARVMELEATVAEMRAALVRVEFVTRTHTDPDFTSKALFETFWETKDIVCKALSTTCGQGWKSPERVQHLIDFAICAPAYAKELSIADFVIKANKALNEAGIETNTAFLNEARQPSLATAYAKAEGIWRE